MSEYQTGKIEIDDKSEIRKIKKAIILLSEIKRDFLYARHDKINELESITTEFRLEVGDGEGL